jgi:hypothetical protein
MSNYTKLTAYDTKDNLTTGDPLKRIKGTELDDEFDAIATAIATKVDSSGATLTSPTLITPALGTPSAAVLTNATGLPLTTGVTGTLPVANGGTGATTLTANNVLLGNGTSALQVVAPGTTGNLLTSNGTTWTSSAPPTSYAGLRSQVFTSSGTFTIPSGITSCKVSLVGGGGAGGGYSASGSQSTGGSGGGAGGAVKWFSSLTSGNTLTVTVGAAGAINGGTGGTSSVASGTQTITTVSATGGVGGASGGTNTVGASGDSGTVSGADLNITALSAKTNPTFGGDSMFGYGGTRTNVNTSPTGNGAGGYGGYYYNICGDTGTVSATAGTAGIVIIEW